MEEQYKNCIETYEISNLGNMRRKLKTGEYKYINGTINNKGYKLLQLRRNNKSCCYTFHSLVAKAFIGDRPEGLVIDHIDRNRLNNNVNNLRYITHTENMRNCDRFKSHIKTEGKERIKECSKEYYETNKDKIKEHQKEYYEDNKDKIKEHQKEYKKTNKDYIKEHSKEYYENNKEHSKEYYKNNKERVKERMKEYYKNNKDSITKYRREQYKNNKEHIKERRKANKNKTELIA